MSRSSQSSDAADDRGEFPVVGLVAAVAVVAGVSGYAVLVAGLGSSSDRPERVARTTLDRAHEEITSGGVAVPARLADAEVAPDAYSVRVRLTAAGRVWRVGPPVPTGVEPAAASRSVGVRLRPGRVRPGRLTVEVWS